MRNEKGHQDGSPKNTKQYDSPSIIECTGRFLQAMRSAGIEFPPAEIIADGQRHIFSPSGKKGDVAGRYIFHSDGIPSGYFEDFRQGIKQNWSAGKSNQQAMSPAERQELRLRVSKQKRETQQALEKQWSDAAIEALRLWKAAKPASTSHPYLVKKQIGAHLARESDSELIIPLYDTGGALHSVQKIGPNGFKMMLKGGRKKGHFCLLNAKLAALDSAKELYVCEGFATGASIAELYIGVPVVVAIDSGNLYPVTAAIRKRWPYLCITIFSDDDRKAESEGKKNVGVESAKAVANQLVNVFVEVPNFPESAPLELSDFNDLINWRAIQSGGEA